ncbi:MAG: shikimate kinase [Defluviitaleaceae bacterium]|nr:shikimate kinase [Defluviitaleaceae bacterium]
MEKGDVTKRCGLLGQKLKHSYSPFIHEALGGSYSYELFEIEPDNLAPFLEQGNFHGLNITIPYKTAIIPFCSELSPIAHTIGSVNTILRRPDSSLYGDNTDVIGFLTMVKRSNIDVSGKKALVLGSGGSSLTVCYGLKELGVDEIVVISRHGEHTYENLKTHQDAQIIINTTPVGMYPNVNTAPVNLGNFPYLEGVFDLIYNPARTRLLINAKNLGIPHIGGLSMLVGQAKASAEIFCTKPIDNTKEAAVLTSLQTQMKNIILIGMPGSGKTTIGQILAEITKRPFYDADTALEIDSTMKILDIFKSEGEKGFRVRETKTLEKLGKESGIVIATGGGCVTREENYPHLHQNGIIIFLERNLSLLEREGRPLSQNVDLSEMYADRYPKYRHFADLTVKNDDLPYIVAKNIWEMIKKGH